MNNLQNLLNLSSIIIKKGSQLLDATGGRFNIFQIIGVTTDEIRLHSAFLCELLNANGSHGLKDKPLEAFIRICLDDKRTYLEESGTYLEDKFYFNTSEAISQVEYYIGVKTETEGGRIDILISDNANRAIIIENKIYAVDQECQMLRYHKYSTKYSNSKLVYLSLDGKLPKGSSLGKASFNYITLSYKFDIIKWLTECKQLAVDLPLVREAISHYINLIKQLTNISLMDGINKEIVSLVMQSPENMQNAFELEKALIDVKIKTQWEFWEQLQKSLEVKGLKIIRNEELNTVDLNKVKGYYVTQKNRPSHFGLWIEVYNREGITIHWGCIIGENIFFGFTIEKDGKGGISNNKEVKSYRQIIIDCDDRYKQNNENWIGWMHAEPMLNFRSFSSQEIFALADKSTLEKTTNQIAERALRDIKFIQDKIDKTN